MPEKSSAAVQMAPSRPLVTGSKTESLSQHIEDLYNRIAKRAYQLFESNGRVNGHDIEHWLEAENSVLQPVHVQLEDNGAEIIVHAAVPRFGSEDIEIHAEPERLIITGSRQSKMEDKKGESTITDESSEEIFREIALPSEVNTSDVTASLKNGILVVTLPKITPSKLSPVESKSS